MVLDTSVSRVSRRGVRTFVATAAALFSVLSMFAPPAQAAAPASAARGDVSVAGWTPVITPLDARKERRKPNLNGQQRDLALNECNSGYLCVAAGQGDGLHTVWELWYCGERSLTNMIDAGHINNRQFGGATARLYDQNRGLRDSIAEGTRADVHWRPIYYLDPC